MPSKPGQYCTRCGTRAVTSEIEFEGLKMRVYVCPNKHGEQRREPIEAAPAPQPPEGTTDQVASLARQKQ